jgi:hypothetical protein
MRRCREVILPTTRHVGGTEPCGVTWQGAAVSRIPDRFLFLWSGRRLPYFARLAIESVLLAEPTASVELHVFGEPPTDGGELRALRRHARFSTKPIDEHGVFDDLGVDADALRRCYGAIPRTALSARSNVLRYAVLARQGGIYLDTDVLLLRSLADLRVHEAFAGAEQVLSIDEARVASGWRWQMAGAAAAWGGSWLLRRADAGLRLRIGEGVARRLDPLWQRTQLNNAVIGATPGARFVRRLLARCTEVDPSIRYRLGPTLISEVAAASADDVEVLPPEAFYAIPPGQSFRYFTGGPMELGPEVRLLHVVSSNHVALLDVLDEPRLLRQRRRGTYYALGAKIVERARALEARP